MSEKNIVIIGGGIGGIVAANKLRKMLPRNTKITLIERNKTHTFAASYLWLMVGQRTPESISVPVKSLVANGINVVYEEVKSIDIPAQNIETLNRKIDYDYLIVSAGTELDKKFLARSEDGIHNFYTFEGSRKLRDALNKIESGDIVIAIEALPYKCPGAPYEAAMLIEDHIKKRGLKDKIKVSLFTPEPQPLPVAGPELGDSVSQIMEQKGIKLYPQHQLLQLDSARKSVKFNDRTERSYDLLIVVPKHNPPVMLAGSGLTDESGWLPVDKNTLQTQVENVFAIGDVSSVDIPGRWKPDKPMKLPKAGVFAHAQALIVSEIIASRVLGKSTNATFCGDGFCMLEAGEDLAGFAYGDFFGEPHPQVRMKQLGKLWHLGKVLFEKWWLSPVGVKKGVYKNMLQLGGRLTGIPIKL